MQHILIIFILFYSLQSHSYLNLLPKGTEQSLMGNNGIALIENDGAGAYNPASIIGIKGPTLSASGSVISISTLKFGEATFQDKSDTPSLELGSPYLTLLLGTNYFNYGFYISNELNFNFNKYLEFNTTGFKGSTNLEINIKINKLGFLIAAEAGPLYYGLSPAIYTITERSNTLTKTESLGTSTNTFDLKTNESSVFATRFGAGYRYKDLILAAYFEPPGSLISNRRTENQSTVSSAGLITDDSNTDSSNKVTKLQWGIGLNYKLSPLIDLIVDFSVLEAEHYYDGNSSEESPRMNRIGVGSRIIYDLDTNIMFGIQQTEYLSYKKTEIFKSIYTNVGVERKISFLKSLFNIFYSSYSNTGSATTEIKNYGLSVGTSYSY